MNTRHLQRISFHKLEQHQPSESLHSFVLIRNSLLQSIRIQQQDSWLDACFNELTPDTSNMDYSDESLETILVDEDDERLEYDQDIDMLLVEDESDEDEEPLSPEESSLQPPPYRSRPLGSPAFFIPIDDDSQEESILSPADNHSTDDTRHHKLCPSKTTLFLSIL